MFAERTPSNPSGKSDRRRFLRGGLAFAAAASGLTGLEACGGEGASPTAATTTAFVAPPIKAGAASKTSATAAEQNVLNLSLNLEYMSAQFYAVAVGGVGVASNLLSGTGTRASATGARRLVFTDPLVAQEAAEIAADKLDHLSSLRSALGAAAAAQPSIDLSPSPTGAFSRLAQAAGLVAAGTAFDPYASDEAFLLAASMFEGAAAAGHRGALPSLSTAAVVEAGTLLAESADAHRGVIRALVAACAIDKPSLNTSMQSLAKARAKLDGTEAETDLTLQNNLISTLPDQIDFTPYSRTSAQVLSVYYLNRSVVSSGGFFPSGVNGQLNRNTTAA